MTAAAFRSWSDTIRWLRQQPDQQELVRAGYYDDPLLDAADRYRHSDEWQAILALLPESTCAVALDVGAGRGIASFALASEGFEVVALEPDPSDLVGAGAIRQLAEQAQLPIRVREGSSETLPFPDATFDVVFGRAVLHHMRDLRRAAREMARVLKPGGTLIAVREHVISRPQDLAAFYDAHPLHRFYGGENAYLLSDYLGALRDAGLLVRHVMAPLRSPVNYAPHSAASLRGEVARRLALGWPLAGRFWNTALHSDTLWRLLVPVLEALDRRPGRLYSFVAARP